ncbi:MAG: NADH-quinone oxidoreductase subunit NuoK [Candidatus Heimdallarchaeota archaeon]|nr:NADH-quinone oxidoreductase subunit NuoK [Candidatus Heimdallarchaeota archaeon]
MIPVEYFMTLSILMFSGGLFGVLTQKNAVRILVSVEILLNSANVALAAFNGAHGIGVEGWTFMLVIIAIAAAEAAIGMAIFLSVYRNYSEIVVPNIFSLGETEEAY